MIKITITCSDKVDADNIDKALTTLFDYGRKNKGQVNMTLKEVKEKTLSAFNYTQK